MKFDPETIYDLAADTARQLLEQTCSDRDVATIAAIHKKLLNDPTIYMDEPTFTSVCKLLKLAGEQMGRPPRHCAVWPRTARVKNSVVFSWMNRAARSPATVPAPFG